MKKILSFALTLSMVSYAFVAVPSVVEAKNNNFESNWWWGNDDEEVESATLYATKIVCDSESDLPNWGVGSANITSSTAQAFLNGHANCHLEPNWSFEWALDGVANPGDNSVGPVGGALTTFGPTNIGGVATTSIPVGEKVWVREVVKDGFIQFAGVTTTPGVSAEIYCHTDVLHYDNWDWISPIVNGGKYYCVAFNVASSTPVVDVCQNIDGPQATIPEGMVESGGQCTTPTPPPAPTDVCPNIDGAQATVPEGKILSEGNCVDPTPVPAQETTNTPAPTNNGGGGGGNGPIVGSFAAPLGQVLGASTSVNDVIPGCSPYILSYMGLNRKNDSEDVKRLQTFLNEYLEANLSVSGNFDPATFEAVKTFQSKENLEVLLPWVKLGLLKQGETTGYVFKTTKRRINLIKCAELDIPLPDLTKN